MTKILLKGRGRPSHTSIHPGAEVCAKIYTITSLGSLSSIGLCISAVDVVLSLLLAQIDLAF